MTPLHTSTVKDRQRRLGEAVRAGRQRLGMSQEGFADAIGVHRTFMGTVERGETNVTLSNLILIAEGLGVRPGDLLNEAFPEPVRHRATPRNSGKTARRGPAL
jgi:transcriptional regulator with XRE-family HTH domain